MCLNPAICVWNAGIFPAESTQLKNGTNANAPETRAAFQGRVLYGMCVRIYGAAGAFFLCGVRSFQPERGLPVRALVQGGPAEALFQQAGDRQRVRQRDVHTPYGVFIRRSRGRLPKAGRRQQVMRAQRRQRAHEEQRKARLEKSRPAAGRPF